jgi:hypothetical protein
VALVPCTREDGAMSSPNPGISAAGEAAGNAALDPSTGPAAIGGMLSPGEGEVEAPPPPSRPPIKDRFPTIPRRRARTPVEDRLTAVVSEISNLVTALEALSIKPMERAPSYLADEGRGGHEPLPAPTSTESIPGTNQARSTYGLGATASATANIAGYAGLPMTATDTPRQAASFYRM